MSEQTVQLLFVIGRPMNVMGDRQRKILGIFASHEEIHLWGGYNRRSDKIEEVTVSRGAIKRILEGVKDE